MLAEALAPADYQLKHLSPSCGLISPSPVRVMPHAARARQGGGGGVNGTCSAASKQANTPRSSPLERAVLDSGGTEGAQLHTARFRRACAHRGEDG